MRYNRKFFLDVGIAICLFCSSKIKREIEKTKLKPRWKYSVYQSRNCKIFSRFFASLSNTTFFLSLSVFLLFSSEHTTTTLFCHLEWEREQENMPTGVTVFAIIVIFIWKRREEKKKTKRERGKKNASIKIIWEELWQNRQ